MVSKRQLIEPWLETSDGTKRASSRRSSIGRSKAAGHRQHAERKVASGQGDQGDGA